VLVPKRKPGGSCGSAVSRLVSRGASGTAQ
jgi:hypothetical protein